mmetsp:Transcript_94902/g.301112  ORF Transcript_94902/g.301112 Transcript_94902/m.301112 type:complete len:217 (-) Transcript_94902:528-1178(-)
MAAPRGMRSGRARCASSSGSSSRRWSSCALPSIRSASVVATPRCGSSSSKCSSTWTSRSSTSSSSRLSCSASAWRSNGIVVWYRRTSERPRPSSFSNSPMAGIPNLRRRRMPRPNSITLGIQMRLKHSARPVIPHRWDPLDARREKGVSRCVSILGLPSLLLWPAGSLRDRSAVLPTPTRCVTCRHVRAGWSASGSGRRWALRRADSPPRRRPLRV